MVINSKFRDVTSQLQNLMMKFSEMRIYGSSSASYLDIVFQIAFEGAPDYLALTGLETIRHGGYGTQVVRHGEQDEFLVDEIRIFDLRLRMIEVCARLFAHISTARQMTSKYDIP